MHLKFRNVNDAFRGLVSGIHSGDIQTEKRPSRNGFVFMVMEPVTVTYENPKERVLFNIARDCNPAFHLYEALWMLAGRNDVDSVAYYAKQMKEYSDDGKKLNGAYGYRWRNAVTTESDGRSIGVNRDIDQLDIIVNHLKVDPNSRRAVLQMWNVEDDLLKIGGDTEQPGAANLQPTSKDVCCNLSVMFSMRDEEWSKAYPPMGITASTRKVLDMTVTNRSNDMIWGMLGANYCHFTFLQEYMAARLGCEVGKYHHFTNNLHVYDWNWKPEEWLASNETTWDTERDARLWDSWYAYVKPNLVPLVHNPAVFDREVKLFCDRHDGSFKHHQKGPGHKWQEPFLETVAEPAMAAFFYHKEKQHSTSLKWCELIQADDWRIACTKWIKRRMK